MDAANRAYRPPALSKAILLPHYWHAHNLNRKIQVTCHLAEDKKLLIVLPSKHSHVWLHNVEELCHNLRSLHT